MRKLVLALMLAFVATGAASLALAGQDGFDFGDMPPLPPPLVDDTPNPPSLTPPAGGSLSPLVQSGGQTPSVSPLAPPPPGGGLSLTPPSSTASPLLPPPGGGSALLPPATPAVPPLTPLAPPPPDAPPVALPGGAPAPGEPAAVAATPAVPEVPRPAKISGGRVNVRAGPNTQYESIAVLTTGAPVTVLAKNGDWYKIVFPADQLASIHKNLVDADITGEIPEAGLPGIVNQDNAEIHAFYWDKSTVVGQLAKGTPVTIKQERGQWYRIAAPESARAFVFAEYVRVDGNAAVAADSAPAPNNPAVDLAMGKPDATGKLAMSADDKKAAALKEAYFKRLQESQIREEQRTEETASQLGQALDTLEARLKAIDAETSSQLSYSVETTTIGTAAWAPPDPIYGGYTGWVENIGRLGGAPASFRLSKGGEIRFYLRSDRFSLNDFIGRRVWVNGRVELASGAVTNVLNVDQIRILTDLEIAEGLRQYEESLRANTVGSAIIADGQPYAAPVADPYDVYFGSGQAAPYAPSAGVIQATPVIPADPSQLPDVVGVGQGGGYGPGISIIGGSSGEVDSDFYETPAISEIGP